MKKLVMLVAALMAVAFVGLNYESTSYANDRAIPSIGVSGGTGSISVVWTAPTEAPYDYRLAWGLNGRYISYKASNTSTAGNAYPGWSATSYTITGLDPGTYRVKLRARYDGSAGPWKAASSVVVTGDAPPVVVVPDPTAEPEPPTSEQQQADPPAAPTGLTASQVAHDSVTLTWTAPGSVSTVTGYKVLRGTDANSLSAIAQDTGSAGAEYTDSTVAADTTYRYAVLALSQDGDGAQSATLSATTPAAPGSKRGEDKPPPKRVTRAAPGVPLNLAVVPGDTQLTFSWDPPTSDGDSDIIRYNYTFGPSGETQADGNHGTDPTGSQTLMKTGLTNGAAYTFKVRAVNRSGGNVTVGTYTAVVTGTPVAPDTTPPTLTSAEVNPEGTQILLVFSEDLDVPTTSLAENETFIATLKSAFVVTVDGTSVSIHQALSQTPPYSRMTLSLSSTIQQNQAVVFSYTDPTSGDDAVALEDAAGNETPSFTTGRNNVPAVTNSSTVADTKGPAFASAAADGTSLVITFYENLAAAASLANSAFTVKKTVGSTEETVTLSATAPVISGKTVTLTLATALVSTDTAVKVSYTKPTTGTANKLVDAAANETGTFTDKSVTNNTPDTTPPSLTSATVQPRGAQIHLVFSEGLDGLETVGFRANLKSYFAATAAGTPMTFDFLYYVAESKTIELVLSNPFSIRQGEAVSVSYNDPTSGDDDVALQDAAGNETPSFTTGRNSVPAVTNSSTIPAVPGPPTSLSASASGTTAIDLSWTAPADNGGRDISGYKVEVSSDSGTTWTVLEATTGTTATTYAHTGLTAGSTRHYRVSAINTIGTGAASNTDSATTPTRVSIPPTSSNSTVTTTEDTDYTFATANFPFSDAGRRRHADEREDHRTARNGQGHADA